MLNICNVDLFEVYVSIVLVGEKLRENMLVGLMLCWSFVICV